MTELEASVRPGSREFAAGWDQKSGRLKVSLTEKPEQGRANAELVRELSKILGAPVELVRGGRDRRKLLRVGLPLEEIKRRLSAPEGADISPARFRSAKCAPFARRRIGEAKPGGV